jgi:hypothetical protein
VNCCDQCETLAGKNERANTSSFCAFLCANAMCSTIGSLAAGGVISSDQPDGRRGGFVPSGNTRRSAARTEIFCHGNTACSKTIATASDNTADRDIR